MWRLAHSVKVESETVTGHASHRHRTQSASTRTASSRCHSRVAIGPPTWPGAAGTYSGQGEQFGRALLGPAAAQVRVVAGRGTRSGPAPSLHSRGRSRITRSTADPDPARSARRRRRNDGGPGQPRGGEPVGPPSSRTPRAPPSRTPARSARRPPASGRRRLRVRLPRRQQLQPRVRRHGAPVVRVHAKWRPATAKSAAGARLRFGVAARVGQYSPSANGRNVTARSGR